MLEKLDRQHPDILQGFQDALRRTLCHSLDRRLQAGRRCQRKSQDSFPVVVLDQRVNRRFARSPAHSQYAQLSCEWHVAFEDEIRLLLGNAALPALGRQRRTRRQFSLRPADLLRIAQNPLPLAVVTHAAGFQNCGQPDLLQRGIERGSIGNRRKFRGGNSQLLKKPLLLQPVLRRFQSRRWRQHRHAFRQELRGLYRDILEFVSDQRQTLREFLQRPVVREFCRDARSDAPYRRFRGGIEKPEVQSQWVAGQRQHVPQLPAAQNPNGHG